MNENISTEELAAALRIQPQTIRAGLCRIMQAWQDHLDGASALAARMSMG